MHTRFEHSLGVMHVASQLFDAIARRSAPMLDVEFHRSDEEIGRDRQVVRLTALLHDTGHSPFSHAGEDVFPLDPTKTKRRTHYKHEAYSAAVIEHAIKDVIETHPGNDYGITASEIATLLLGGVVPAHLAFWRHLIDSQMDADRMDYLLRDSLHVGVDYGKYDWRRLVYTMVAVEQPQRPGDLEPLGIRIGVTDGGLHAVEALILARYFMFTQVYFHKTRVAYDRHIREALKTMLHGGTFPLPTKDGIQEYLGWDDWKVLGQLANGGGGEHGGRLRDRNHYRQVYSTPENPSQGYPDLTAVLQNTLADLIVAEESSTTSSYKPLVPDILVVNESDSSRVSPLSRCSSIARNLTDNPIEILRLYALPERAAEVRERVDALTKRSTR